MNPRLTQVHESATLKVADRVAAMERQGRTVIKLQTGDPDFSTPEIITDAAYQAMKSGFTHYGPSRGLPELRQAIGRKLNRDNGMSMDPETEILVTHGAAHGLFITFQTLLSPGDEVLLLEPYYMSYASSIRIAGGVPVTVTSDPRNGFRVDPDQMSARITARTKIIVVNSPCNPSGTVLSESELHALCVLAIKHNLLVVSDEVYEKLIFDGVVHRSIAACPGMAERTVTINSLSKTYAMTGWRIGYVTAPRAITSQMLKVLQYSATNIAVFIQKAAVVALTTPELNVQIESMRVGYSNRRRLALEAASRLEGINVLAPQGAFYLMVDISRAGMPSVELAAQLIDESGVAVVPGAAFGGSAEGWIRLTFSIAAEQVIEGLVRISEFVKRRRTHRNANR